MKTTQLVLVLFFSSLITFNCFSQNFEWAKNWGGNHNDKSNAVCTDAFGNVYTTGFFRNTADFDPGVAIAQDTSAGWGDIFISKIDSDGNFKWAKKIGGVLYDEGRSITTDAHGNVYVTGSFYLIADFNPGAGVHTFMAYGHDDIFIVKLDSAGNFKWAKQLGGANYEEGLSITIDLFGNVYTTGFFQGHIDFDPGSGTYNLNSAGFPSTRDIFISKLDSAGNFKWAKKFGGSGWDYGYSVVTDGNGNVYTTGSFNGTVDFDPGSGVFNLTSTGISGSNDVFISKLNSAGNFVWAKQFSSTDYGGATSMSLDPFGNLYVTGSFNGTMNFNTSGGTYNLTSSGSYDVFVSKLDSAGNLQWAKHFGSTGYDLGSSITTDMNGNTYTSGLFEGTVDFDPDISVFNFTSVGGKDGFTVKLDAAGNFQWANQIGGVFDDRTYSIALDEYQNIYTTGYFAGTVDFDTSIDTFNLSATGAGGFDCFLHKISQCTITSATISQVSCISYTVPSGDETYTVSGTYFDTIPNSWSCDSLLTINLTINSPTSSTKTVVACNSYTVPSGDETYTTSGIYMDTIPNAVGCDSIMTLNLTIHNSTTSIQTVTACDNYTAPSGNETYTVSGTYYDTIPNAVGCDSIITIHLTINNSTSSTQSITACNSYIVPSGDETYTASGTYTDTIPNMTGCDSILTINLTISNTTSSTQSITACNSYTVPSGDEIYTTSGTYIDTIPNSVGCDSILTIHLTINNTTSSTQSITACNSYTVPSGDETYTASGTYTDTIQNMTGCDSILTINLTISNTTSSTQFITACDSYTVPSGDETYTASGTYIDTIPNSVGCDSIIKLNLTINTVDVSVTDTSPSLIANATGASYQWLDCDNNYSVLPDETNQVYTSTVNGSFAVEVTHNSCVDTSNCFLINTVGIIENEFDKTPVIFPNPTTGKVNVDLGTTYNEVSIIINNALGQEVLRKSLENSDLLELNLPEEVGMYFIEIWADDKRAILKVIKE